MAKLTPDLLEYIRQKAEEVAYGTITIELNEGGNFSRILVTEEKRFKKEEGAVPKKKFISKSFSSKPFNEG